MSKKKNKIKLFFEDIKIYAEVAQYTVVSILVIYLACKANQIADRQNDIDYFNNMPDINVQRLDSNIIEIKTRGKIKNVQVSILEGHLLEVLDPDEIYPDSIFNGQQFIYFTKNTMGAISLKDSVASDLETRMKYYKVENYQTSVYGEFYTEFYEKFKIIELQYVDYMTMYPILVLTFEDFLGVINQDYYDIYKKGSCPNIRTLKHLSHNVLTIQNEPIIIDINRKKKDDVENLFNTLMMRSKVITK